MDLVCYLVKRPATTYKTLVKPINWVSSSLKIVWARENATISQEKYSGNVSTNVKRKELESLFNKCWWILQMARKRMCVPKTGP